MRVDFNDCMLDVWFDDPEGTMLGDFERVRTICIFYPAGSCVEEQALFLEGVCVDEVPMEAWDERNILKLDRT